MFRKKRTVAFSSSVGGLILTGTIRPRHLSKTAEATFVSRSADVARRFANAPNSIFRPRRIESPKTEIQLAMVGGSR
jgi:hypothetical protein